MLTTSAMLLFRLVCALQFLTRLAPDLRVALGVHLAKYPYLPSPPLPSIHSWSLLLCLLSFSLPSSSLTTISTHLQQSHITKLNFFLHRFCAPTTLPTILYRLRKKVIHSSSTVLHLSSKSLHSGTQSSGLREESARAREGSLPANTVCRVEEV